VSTLRFREGKRTEEGVCDDDTYREVRAGEKKLRIFQKHKGGDQLRRKGTQKSGEFIHRSEGKGRKMPWVGRRHKGRKPYNRVERKTCEIVEGKNLSS